MSTFGGRIRGLENILIDNFLSYKSHTCFFLSHCHSDHMCGLDQLFLALNDTPSQYIYCSPISRVILSNKYNIANGDFIKELTTPKVITIPENAAAPSYQVTVTPIPAGHCPGSIMFLFETVHASILYTGDFRISKDDIAKFKCLHSKNLVKSIDKLYFDSTFLTDAFWEFPSRSESVMELLDLIINWIKKSPQHNVSLETCALYGYEYVMVELARKLNCRIHVKDFLLNIYWNVPEVGCFMTNDCRSTQIHATSAFGKKCVPVDNEKVLRIKLSAQWYKSTKGRKGDVSVCKSSTMHAWAVVKSLRYISALSNMAGASQSNFDRKEGRNWWEFLFCQKIWKEVSKGNIWMCYSNHCSCSELVEFLNHLQPTSLEPCCVPVGSTKEDTKSYIEGLMLLWPRERRKRAKPEGSDFPLAKNYKFRIRFPEMGTNAKEDELEF